MSYTADFGMVLQLVSCKPCLSMWQGNCCSNEAEDVPLKTTISIKKRDCFCSHIRVHPLPVPEEAHPKGLMQEFPRTNAEEVPITLPEGEATVTVHSIYSRIGILLRTALADYEGSINVLMDEVSSDMGDRDTKWTSHSLCLESIANSSSEEEDSAATQTSLMPCPKEGNSKDGKDSEERSNVVPVIHLLLHVLHKLFSAIHKQLFGALPIQFFYNSHANIPGLIQALMPCTCSLYATSLQNLSVPFLVSLWTLSVTLVLKHEVWRK
ncbi:uncharacterized protein LOC122231206 isoform X1 [Panthera tigris]|uniref:uncharacterized protein LOC122231206 isoform X1 n=1 Tax=Panthera tigris TaxID=9694 RepID=UPI001C6FA2C4|nr:uncharacterized protein LOC122231206 isoform X1 [Panthera tigris]